MSLLLFGAKGWGILRAWLTPGEPRIMGFRQRECIPVSSAAFTLQ